MHQGHIAKPGNPPKCSNYPAKPKHSSQQRPVAVFRLSRNFLSICAALFLCNILLQTGLVLCVAWFPASSDSLTLARAVASKLDLGLFASMLRLVSLASCLPVPHGRPRPPYPAPAVSILGKQPAASGSFQHGNASAGCNASLCPASRPSIPSSSLTLEGVSHAARTSVSTSATATAEPEMAEKNWWKDQTELWTDVRNIAEFRQEVSSGDKLVLVDFFATWCNGCRLAYPHLCSLARDPEVRDKFKFVKVCVDQIKALARAEGITSLPVVAVYDPQEGKLVSMDVPPSKVRNLRHNLELLLGNPGMAYKMDVRGFVVPYPKPQPADQERQAQADKAAAEDLRSSKSGLFEHLLGVANSGVNGAAAPNPTGLAKGNAAALSNGSGVKPASAEVQSDTNGAAAPSPCVQPAPKEEQPTHYHPNTNQQTLQKNIFLRKHSDEYGYSGKIDKLYPLEVGCRMAPNEHYLDYTGASVYCQSQLDAVFNELKTCMFGNPHSANPSSKLSSEKVDEVRDLILQYFNADPALYQVVFTRSATSALKMVGEMFPWSKGSVFRYLRENHNSVLGVREYALENDASFESVNDTFVEQWVSTSGPDAMLDHHPAHSNSHPSFNLFAFPLEDNFAGVKYPQRWVQQVQSRSTQEVQWKVMVDAAAYVPTQPLDLSRVRADFVVMSFYKMFGYPTGLGALIVKVDAAEVLHKTFWGGGTVALATSSQNFHVLKCKPTDKLEDGTVSFLDIISLKHGFKCIEKLGGIHRVQLHVASLTEWLYGKLSGLRHSNGAPMLKIFGKHHLPNHREVQGGILNFEVLRPNGSVYSYKAFEEEAAQSGFHVRTGAECNPGACYSYLGVQESEVQQLAGLKEGCEDNVEFMEVQRPHEAAQVVRSADVLPAINNSAISLGHPAEVALKWVQVPLGSVRVSLGYMSTFEDCFALYSYIKDRYTDIDIGEPTKPQGTLA